MPRVGGKTMLVMITALDVARHTPKNIIITSSVFRQTKIVFDSFKKLICY
jgi:hypothetical protein